MRYITLNPSFPCGAAVARETVNFQVTSSNLVGGVGRTGNVWVFQIEKGKERKKGAWEPKGDTAPAYLSYSLPSNAVKIAESVFCGWWALTTHLGA